MKKGKLVEVDGRLQMDTYEKDGETRLSAEIVADNVQMLDWGSPEMGSDDSNLTPEQLVES